MYETAGFEARMCDGEIAMGIRVLLQSMSPQLVEEMMSIRHCRGIE